MKPDPTGPSDQVFPDVIHQPRRPRGAEDSTTCSPRYAHPSTFTIGMHAATAAAGQALVPNMGPAFVLHQIIGEGGFGEVWEATQLSLERIVAVKRVTRDPATAQTSKEFDDEESREIAEATYILDYRFRQEAIITANLEHPNIVPVYDLGFDAEGRPLLAMKRVHGQQWKVLIREDFARLPFDDYLAKHLNILVDVTQAVAFAHSRGIVHRDLKPSQVMVGEFGEVVVMDWGLAIQVGAPSDGLPSIDSYSVKIPDRTTAENPAGTPSMMAPEQTRRSAEDICVQTDVYLLGGVLYHLLTGTYPHEAESRALSIRKARSGLVEPPDVRAPDRNIPEELIALAMRALEPQAKNRFATAVEFADAIRDYLTGSSARSESRALSKQVDAQLIQLEQRAEESSSRESTSIIYHQLNEVLNDLVRAVGMWGRNPEVPPLQLRAHALYARLALREGDLTLGRVMAERIGDSEVGSGLLELIDAEEHRARNMARQRHVLLGTLAGALLLMILGGWRYWVDHRSSMLALESQRDLAERHQLIALQQRSFAEQARDFAEREQYFSAIAVAEAAWQDGRPERAEEMLLRGTPESYRDIEWGLLAARMHRDDLRFTDGGYLSARPSPDNAHVVLAGFGTLELRTMPLGEVVWTKPVGTHNLWDVNWSADGTQIGAVSFDGHAYVVSAESGEIVHAFATGVLQRAIAFHPTEPVVLHGGRDAVIHVRDRESGEVIRKLEGFERDVYAFEFTPDGDRLAVICRGKRISVWDWRTGERLLRTEPFERSVLGMAVHPNGRYLLTSGRDMVIRVHDIETLDSVRTFYYPDAIVHSVAFSPDGRYVASADDYGACYLWDFESGRVATKFHTPGPMFRVSFSSDGKRIVTAAPSAIALTRLASLLEESIVEPLAVATVSPEQPTLVRVFGAPAVRDITFGGLEEPWQTQTGLARVIEEGSAIGLIESRWDHYSPDRRLRVIISRDDDTTRVIDTTTGEVVHEPGVGTVYDAVFSPDGKHLALSRWQDIVLVYCAETWELCNLIAEGPSRDLPEDRRKFHNSGLAFSPDGMQLAIGYLNDKIALWDLETDTRTVLIEDHPGIGLVVKYSPDGSILATGGSPMNLHTFDTRTGAMLNRGVGHLRTVIDIAFSPDGRRIVTVAKEGAVKLWETESLREIMTVVSHPPPYQPLGAGFTPDGRGIVIADTFGKASVIRAFPWRVDEYPGGRDMPLEDRIALYKYEQRVMGVPDAGVRLTPQTALQIPDAPVMP